jgi:hypothetical protein
MSGFPSCKPTLSEVQDTSEACGVHTHMTSEAAWGPHSLHHNEIESTLWDSFPQDHPHSLLSPLQVRGLSEVAVRLAIDQVPDEEAEAMPFFCDISPHPMAEDTSPHLPSE